MNLPSRFKLDSTQSTGLQFIRVYNKWHSLVRDALAQLGLTHPQFVFMAVTGYLAQSHDHITQKMISDFSDIDPMTVSQLARLLEKKHRIERRSHPTDTRAKSIVLTENGETLLKKAVPIVEDIDEHFFGRLGEKEVGLKHSLELLLKA